RTRQRRFGVCSAIVTTDVQSPRGQETTEAADVPQGMDRLARLEDRTLPQFNQIVIWSLLATAAILAIWPFELREGERAGVVSLLSWLPDAAVGHPATWFAMRLLLAAGIVLWVLNTGLPWSCWLVVAGFTGLWSLHVETTYNTAHIFNMANMLLVIKAIWFTAVVPLIIK